jgi:hypothetical protein
MRAPWPLHVCSAHPLPRTGLPGVCGWVVAGTAPALSERGADPPSPSLSPLTRSRPAACALWPGADAAQDKFNQFLDKLTQQGISFIDALTSRREFRNPDFLQHLVEHYKVKQYGSAFAPEVFSPEALSADDTAGACSACSVPCACRGRRAQSFGAVRRACLCRP